MTTISIVHTKGGVGKTTSSIFLATAAARRGQDVVVIDGDPQRSAAVWAEAAQERGSALPFDVVESPTRLDLDRELVIMDTPPGTSRNIQSAIDIADLAIVPCGCSPIDVERVWPTLDMTVKQCPAVVLLTQVDLRARLWEKVRSLLEKEGVPVMTTVIPQRQSIRRAFGTVPAEMHGYDDALTELEGVYQGV
ncbi:ParA-like partition protein [Mycobacterium phage EagleEye]|uniref:ParA-like dsDNA partitioning protein n=1 Tax=Mycobacterium phage EagleEye TaxID=1429759 RepID=W0LIU2_9CAUD|nr:ParA-like partition protein [Mycobacterium phage EagleEye]AHG23818.1 ParA-like dsDNA partitioning protein [Mycobacterium phage EagleEye]QNJ55880.1 ParA-like dsDNA partitioning protein [Mycobacterium phage PainterBoy]